MLLSIVIPQYNETDETIRPLLESIDLQRGVDFNEVEVIIVNGGSENIISDALLGSFQHIKPKFMVVPEEHRGSPGLSRQAGLDVAKGEYVTFCDGDDVYHSVGVLSMYFDTIRVQKPQILMSSWLEELKAQDGRMLYITHSRENTWMHGKVFLRSFLMSYSIRYSEELLYHEDSYFNSNAMAMADPNRVLYNDAVTYVWTWDENSITRRNGGAYSWESMEEFTHAIRLSCRWLKDRRPEQLPEKVAQCLMYVFYCITANLDNWEEKYIDAASHEWYEMYGEFKTEFNSLPFDKLSAIQLQERGRVQVPFMERITFFDFLAKLEEQLGGENK